MPGHSCVWSAIEPEVPLKPLRSSMCVYMYDGQPSESTCETGRAASVWSGLTVGLGHFLLPFKVKWSKPNEMVAGGVFRKYVRTFNVKETIQTRRSVYILCGIHTKEQTIWLYPESSRPFCWGITGVIYRSDNDARQWHRANPNILMALHMCTQVHTHTPTALGARLKATHD